MIGNRTAAVALAVAGVGGVVMWVGFFAYFGWLPESWTVATVYGGAVVGVAAPTWMIADTVARRRLRSARRAAR